MAEEWEEEDDIYEDEEDEWDGSESDFEEDLIPLNFTLENTGGY